MRGSRRRRHERSPCVYAGDDGLLLIGRDAVISRWRRGRSGDEPLAGYRMANLTLRSLRVAPVALCILAAACTRSDHSATTNTPTPVLHPTNTVPAATDTAPVASPTSVPTPEIEPRVACEGYIATLTNRDQDPGLLDNPGIRAIARALPDLVICAAVVRDSDEPCNRLLPAEQGPGGACRHARSIFHELRTYPTGRSFMFDDLDWEGCYYMNIGPTTACDAFRDALRSADAKKCAAAGDGQSICRAFVTLDKSLCRARGKLKELGAEEGCRKAIESRAFLAKGLKAVAESGPAREREFAKAALGQADACASFARTALEACIANAPVRPVAEATPLAAGNPPAATGRQPFTTGSPAPPGALPPTGSAPGHAPQA